MRMGMPRDANMAPMNPPLWLFVSGMMASLLCVCTLFRARICLALSLDRSMGAYGFSLCKCWGRIKAHGVLFPRVRPWKREWSLVLSREKRVEMSTVAMTVTKSISHIGTDRKAFAVRRVQAHATNIDRFLPCSSWGRCTRWWWQARRGKKVRWKVSTAAGQKNNGNYNHNSSINVPFQGGTMFWIFFSVPLEECNILRDQKPWWVTQDSINCVFFINVKKHPTKKVYRGKRDLPTTLR